VCKNEAYNAEDINENIRQVCIYIKTIIIYAYICSLAGSLTSEFYGKLGKYICFLWGSPGGGVHVIMDG
jgi:hypothetical protein